MRNVVVVVIVVVVIVVVGFCLLSCGCCYLGGYCFVLLLLRFKCSLLLLTAVGFVAVSVVIVYLRCV